MKLFVGAKGLVVHKGKILLLRESGMYKDGTNAGKWDVPGGRIKPEETVFEGLIREVQEESGLVVRPTGKILEFLTAFLKCEEKGTTWYESIFFVRRTEARLF